MNDAPHQWEGRAPPGEGLIGNMVYQEAADLAGGLGRRAHRPHAL